MADVLATLERLNIQGRSGGSEFVARCPLHQQRTGREDSHPSWSINLITGLHLCFSCGYRGSLRSLVMDLEGVPLEEADTFLVKGNLKTSIARIPDAYRPVQERPSIPESLLAPFIDPPEWACQSRYLTEKACAEYTVRWDPYRDSWILPVRDYDGLLVGYQSKDHHGRGFRNHPLGVKKSNYLFGYHRFAGGRIIVVESPLDAVRIYSAGIEGAVSTFGAIVSPTQIRLLSAADEVIFALDADDAGRRASRQLLQSTRGVLQLVKFFHYTGKAKDPGEMTDEQILHGLDLARSRVLGEAAL